MSHSAKDAANKLQIVHPTQWRWTHTAPYRIAEYGDTPTGGMCAVYLPEHGSWYRVAYIAYESPIDGSVGWYESELQCTPAYTNGEPDTEAWGSVDEHGFECMGMPEGHTHDPLAVQWMEAINSALHVTFFLEDFE